MSNKSKSRNSVVLRGVVTDGKGEGKFFVSLDGYAKQFQSKLGYTPFPGTLNFDLTSESIEQRVYLSALDPIYIEEWERDDRTYGPVACYPADLVSKGSKIESVHALVPERTDHNEDQLEVIASVNLREAHNLSDGDQLTIRIENQQ